MKLFRYAGLYTQECSVCGEVKEYSEYGKHKNQIAGRQPQCGECIFSGRDRFKGLPRETNPETGEPYKRGELKDGEYVFGTVSRTSINKNWDKPYLPVRTCNLDEYMQFRT